MRKKIKEDIAENREIEGEAGLSKELPRFSKDQLRKNCLKLFGVTPSTFDGAAYGVEKKLTVDEMREHISEWNSMRAKPHK